MSNDHTIIKPATMYHKTASTVLETLGYRSASFQVTDFPPRLACSSPIGYATGVAPPLSSKMHPIQPQIPLFYPGSLPDVYIYAPL